MRILFVAMQNSVHTAGWIEQILDQGWDLHFAPSGVGHLRQELQGKSITYHGPETLSQLITYKRAMKVLKFLRVPSGKHLFPKLMSRLEVPISSMHLAEVIQRVQPDVVHSMETQSAGYNVLEVKKILGGKMPLWIHSNWGSDLYLYHRLPNHKPKLEQILASCDYYYAECERDFGLARQLGFKGISFPLRSMAGGIRLDKIEPARSPLPPSQRKYILLKGYQNWAGRALNGLQAIELCADIIRERGYKLMIQLADPDVVIAAQVLANDEGIPLEILPRGTHAESLKRIGMARVHIGLSISEGLSTSCLESMALGTFPIQSNTSCLNTMLQDGVDGFLVPHWDPHAIADALHQALTNDQLVDEASINNQQHVHEHWVFDLMKQQTLIDYNQVFERVRQSRTAKLK